MSYHAYLEGILSSFAPIFSDISLPFIFFVQCFVCYFSHVYWPHRMIWKWTLTVYFFERKKANVCTNEVSVLVYFSYKEPYLG